MKFCRRSVLLFSLLILSCGVFWMVPDPQSVPERLKGDFLRERVERGRDLGGSRLPSTAEAERISRPGWRPPLVFCQPGEAVFPVPYARGENGRRRFAEPVTRVLAAEEHVDGPAIMARLPEDGRTHLQPVEIDQFTLRGRRLAFHQAALEAVLTGKTRRLLAPSVDQEVLELVIESVTSRDALTHTLSGKVTGEEETSVAQLVFHDGILHGNVVRYASGRELEYRILADGHLMVRELDQLAMTAPCGAADEAGLGQEEEGAGSPDLQEGTTAGDTTGYRTVDVVVGYGRDARIADGGAANIEARIIASVDRMNLAFANSEISNAETMLLGTIEDPEYRFPGAKAQDMNEELSQLEATNDGVLDAVSDYREELGADLVSFVILEDDGSAGFSNIPGRDSIVARTYMTGTRITFAHELAHNLGCDHSWGDSSQVYQSAYGWRLDPPSTVRVRTIMAYDWNWGAGLRIPHFANPAVLFNGARTGATPGYDVRGDFTADQRYAIGGLGYPGSLTALSGFDGTNPTLAAMNADTIDTGGGLVGYGVGPASNRATRSHFVVVTPAAGEGLEPGSTQEIFFTGGDGEDLATLQLLRNGSVIATLAHGLNAATQRRYAWTLGEGLDAGSGYQVRVVLDRNGSQITADSGVFEIYVDSPRIIAHSPDDTMEVESVSDLKLIFNRSMDPTGFSVTDDVLSFTGPGGVDLKPTIVGGTWSSSETVLTLSFPELAAVGSYTLVLAPTIPDAAGEALDQDSDLIPGEAIDDRYTARFDVFSLGAAVDAPQLTWATSGDAVWIPQSEVTFDGVDAAQSGVVPDGGITWLETTVVGPGTLSFRWKVDSEAGYDWLEFYLNGILQGGSLSRISGPVDWQQRTLELPAGTQTVRWLYRKDPSVSEGADRGWLDEVVYTPESMVSFTVTFRANGSTGGIVPDEVILPEGASLTIPGNTGGLSRTGFSFIGWNTAADGSGTTFLPGDSYLMAEDLELFARWNALPEALAGSDEFVVLPNGGSWSPAVLAPAAWYDAAEADTIETDGSRVVRWLDKSDNGRHATQGEPGSRPVLQGAGFGNLPVIVFDGSSSFLEVDLDYLAGTSHSAFVVTRTTVYSNIYGAANPASGSNSLHIGFRNSTNYRANYWGNQFQTAISSNFKRDDGNVLNFIWRQGVGREIFANGWSEGSNTSAGVIGAMAGGGRIGNVTGDPLYGGEIAEMIFYPTDPAPGERERVEGYLAHKWGLEDHLPPGHPYRLSGPAGAGVTVVLPGSGSDPESDPLSYLWTFESGPEEVFFDDPTVAQQEVTFSVPGTYVLRLSVSDGFGTQFDEVTITVGGGSLYDLWASGSFAVDLPVGEPSGNPDGDAFVNLQEFAFGLDPTDSVVGTLSYVAGGGLTTSGPPRLEALSGVGAVPDIALLFPRRKDYLEAGLGYVVEFSADLAEWTASGEEPVLLTSVDAAGDLEVVAMPFPAAVSLATGGTAAPRFCRVEVTMTAN